MPFGAANSRLQVGGKGLWPQLQKGEGSGADFRLFAESLTERFFSSIEVQIRIHTSWQKGSSFPFPGSLKPQQVGFSIWMRGCRGKEAPGTVGRKPLFSQHWLDAVIMLAIDTLLTRQF